jgi:hypothetical protein
MEGGTIYLLGLVGVGIAFLFLYALLKMAHDSDRAARHTEKRLVPYSDVTLTEIR